MGEVGDETFQRYCIHFVESDGFSYIIYYACMTSAKLLSKYSILRQNTFDGALTFIAGLLHHRVSGRSSP